MNIIRKHSETTAKLLKTRYFWYVAIMAFLAGILSHAPQVATLLHLPFMGDGQLAFFVAAYRLLFLLSVVIAAWRFGVKGGLIVCLIVGPAVLSADFSTASVWLDVAVVAIGIMFSWVVGKQGEMKRALEKTTEEIRRQSTMLESEVTERKRAEEKRRTILKTALDGFWLANLKGEFIEVNDSYCEMVGYTREELLRMSIPDLEAAEGPEEVAQHIKRIMEQGYDRFESQHKRKDGQIIDVEVSVNYLDVGEGQLFVFVRDITERKRAEEELRQSHEQLRNLSAHIESMREVERTSIAREVHDELGQSLTAIKMDLSWLNKRLPEEQEAIVKKIREMLRLIDTTIQTVKRISTDLRPGILDDLGLVAAIEWQAQEFQERTRIRCELTTEVEDINLDRDLATAVFRILQEALTNVARHADATRVEVSLKKRDGRLVLQVRDNGIGITEEQITHPRSFGLIGMRERARSWNGSVKIDGISGKGTIVTVSIPLK